VIDEVLACMAMGYKSIDFADSNFNNSARHVKAVCEELIRRKEKYPGRAMPGWIIWTMSFWH
jgi:hypothetical protein